jgi:hypothetical protein
MLIGVELRIINTHRPCQSGFWRVLLYASANRVLHALAARHMQVPP